MGKTYAPAPTLSTAVLPSADEADAIRVDLLSNAPYYDFFYAVGMLERLNPEAVRVGDNGPYPDEAIRFCHDPSLGFRAGDISAIRYVERPRSTENAWEPVKHRFEVTTTFLGLIGVVSPLPLYIAEEIVQSQDSTIKRDFLDIFHHRLVSFVYRIGIKHDLAREYTTNASDAWSRRILALAGFDLWGGRKLRHIPAWRILRLAPLLAHRARSSRSLELAIEDCCEEALWGAKVRIEQFMGEWTPLAGEQRMSLALRNHALGESSVLGRKIFDPASKAVIFIETLGDNFRRFLSDGDMYPVILELISLMAEEPIEYQLELVINEKARPPFKLSTRNGGRLGVESWLSSETAANRDLTRMRVDLPNSLPNEAASYAFGWQSQPQRNH